MSQPNPTLAIDPAIVQLVEKRVTYRLARDLFEAELARVAIDKNDGKLRQTARSLQISVQGWVAAKKRIAAKHPEAAPEIRELVAGVARLYLANDMNWRAAMRRFSRELATAAVQATHGNKAMAARWLQLHNNWVQRIIAGSPARRETK